MYKLCVFFALVIFTNGALGQQGQNEDDENIDDRYGLDPTNSKQNVIFGGPSFPGQNLFGPQVPNIPFQNPGFNIPGQNMFPGNFPGQNVGIGPNLSGQNLFPGSNRPGQNVFPGNLLGQNVGTGSNSPGQNPFGTQGLPVIQQLVDASQNNIIQNQFGQNPVQRTTEAPTTAAGGQVTPTTQSTTLRQCIANCPVTSEYNPVCGTDNVTYDNPGRLICAQGCGVNVRLLRTSRCVV